MHCSLKYAYADTYALYFKFKLEFSMKSLYKMVWYDRFNIIASLKNAKMLSDRSIGTQTLALKLVQFCYHTDTEIDILIAFHMNCSANFTVDDLVLPITTRVIPHDMTCRWLNKNNINALVHFLEKLIILLIH